MHTDTYVYYAIATYIICNYVFIQSVASSDSVYKRYVTTVYWASATSTSVGYGDIIAYTDFEVV